MEIQFNTDNNIEDSGRVSEYFTGVLEKELQRFQPYVTRFEVHLSDENSIKEVGDDKKCVIEARMKGKSPFVVSNNADTNEKAIKGAIQKIKKALDSEVSKLKNY